MAFAQCSPFSIHNLQHGGSHRIIIARGHVGGGEKRERERSWNDAAPFCGGGRIIGADSEPGVLETYTWMACIHAIYFAFGQMERGQAEKVLRLPDRVLIIARSSQPFPRRSRPWDPLAHYLRTGWLVH